MSYVYEPKKEIWDDTYAIKKNGKVFRYAPDRISAIIIVADLQNKDHKALFTIGCMVIHFKIIKEDCI